MSPLTETRQDDEWICFERAGQINYFQQLVCLRLLPAAEEILCLRKESNIAQPHLKHKASANPNYLSTLSIESVLCD
jgi:hypothetical protein